jgi:DNA-binding transcriptional LysR family regulator
MDTIDSEALRAFVAVAEAGSFTRAAEQLRTRKAHLSRVVSRLEARLGARLLQRTTRSLALTEVGRDVFERSVGILVAMEETLRVVRHTQAAPAGTLRVTSGYEFGVLVVGRLVERYLERYTGVRVEAELTNRIVDLVHEGFDVGVRVGPLEDSGLAQRKLGQVGYGLFAAPRYLARRRPPRRVDDLRKHDLVLSTQTRRGPGVWELVRKDERRALPLTPRLLVSTHMAARDAAVAGAGIALLPAFQARPHVESGELTPVLPGWGRDPAPVHAIFPSTRFLDPKVRAFVDLALECFDALV